MELKNFDSLMLEGQQLEKKKKRHREKVEDLVDLNLQLSEMSWNYIGDKGQTYMKIELKNLNFRVNEREEEVETILTVGRLNINDRVFEYKKQQYQHLLKG
jgi:hypothetical protein